MNHAGHKQGQVACVRVPNFCWQIEVGRHPPFDENRPVFVTCSALELPQTGFSSSNSANDLRLSEPVVLDFSAGVTDVTAGMPLEIALSRHSDALLVQGDLPLYMSAFENLLVEFEQLIPAVEDAGPGVAYIDLNGLDRLYGTTGAIIRRLAGAAGNFDLRIGIGENKWQAYLASLVSGPHMAQKVRGDPARFVGKFSVEHLPVPFKIIERLHQFGLHTLADLAKLPRGPVEAQFGLSGQLMWLLANGTDDRPLIPRKIVETVSEYLTFPDPTVSMAAIVSAIESLLGKVLTKPQMMSRYARRAQLQAHVFRKPPWMLDVAFKEPVGSKNRAMFGIKTKLDGVQFPGALEDLRLSLTSLSSEPWRQESMWKDVQREDNLHQAVAQLAVRLRTAPPIYQVKELEPWSRIPERRHALVQLSH